MPAAICRVEDFDDFLHFEVVVARAERAHFAPLSFPREFRHAEPDRPPDTAALLDPVQIFPSSKSTIDSPTRPTPSMATISISLEGDVAHGADAGRHMVKKRAWRDLAERKGFARA